MSATKRPLRLRAEQINERSPAFLGDPVIPAAFVCPFIVYEAVDEGVEVDAHGPANLGFVDFGEQRFLVVR